MAGAVAASLLAKAARSGLLAAAGCFVGDAAGRLESLRTGFSVADVSFFRFESRGDSVNARSMT